MLGYCRHCDKLTPIAPRPRTPDGKLLYRVLAHEDPRNPGPLCPGMSKPL